MTSNDHVLWMRPNTIQRTQLLNSESLKKLTKGLPLGELGVPNILQDPRAAWCFRLLGDQFNRGTSLVSLFSWIFEAWTEFPSVLNGCSGDGLLRIDHLTTSTNCDSCILQFHFHISGHLKEAKREGKTDFCIVAIGARNLITGPTDTYSIVIQQKIWVQRPNSTLFITILDNFRHFLHAPFACKPQCWPRKLLWLVGSSGVSSSIPTR